MPGFAGRSHSLNFDQRRRPETFFTAMATAFFCPTRTTRRLPRVTPVRGLHRSPDLQVRRRRSKPVQAVQDRRGAFRADAPSLPVRRTRQPGPHFQSRGYRSSLGALCGGQYHHDPIDQAVDAQGMGQSAGEIERAQARLGGSRTQARRDPFIRCGSTALSSACKRRRPHEVTTQSQQPLSTGSSACVDEGMGEAANVCCASKRAPKRGSPSRPTNACGSLTRSDADHGKKRDPRGDETNEAVNGA
jgi:hypothetical protein